MAGSLKPDISRGMGTTRAWDLQHRRGRRSSQRELGQREVRLRIFKYPQLDLQILTVGAVTFDNINCLLIIIGRVMLIRVGALLDHY
eukprot:m.296956 g.296956  ORF g.296956 m.296956 type:complete len:87 (-) comp16283_c1_seq11:417-677(-)